MIEIEVDQAVEQLRKSLGNLSKQKFDEAVYKSINAAMTKARKASYDEISRVYKVRSISDVTKKLRGVPARPNRLQADLYADPLGIQMAYFAPAQDISNKRRISVEIRAGQRKTLQSAFWTKANAGGGNELQSIFAKGGYSGREFVFRSKRIKPWPAPDTPIGLLRTTSPFSMLKDRDVQERIEKVAQEHMYKGLERRVARLLSNQGTGG